MTLLYLALVAILVSFLMAIAFRQETLTGQKKLRLVKQQATHNGYSPANRR